MRTISPLIALVAALAACAGEQAVPAADGATAPASDAASADAVAAPDTPPLADAAADALAIPLPGFRVYDPGTPGRGHCKEKLLGDAILAVQAGWPALKEVSTTLDVGIDDFIFAFVHDGGFALVFQRGLKTGDCPLGCVSGHEYWYFTTGPGCSPIELGRYVEDRDFAMGCFAVQGMAMWKLPRPLDPATICGADNTPRDVSGTYRLAGKGEKGEVCARPSRQLLMPEVTLVVAQEPQDLATGTVVLQGVGDPRVDGKVMPAKFLRRRFSATTVERPNQCNSTSVTLKFDWENNETGSLDVDWVAAPACPADKGQLCRGQLALTLAPPR